MILVERRAGPWKATPPCQSRSTRTAGLRNGFFLLLVLIFAPTAAAQYPGGGAGSRGADVSHIKRPPGTGGQPKSDAPIGLNAEVQSQLDELQDLLKPTAAQQRSFDAYSERVRKLADDIARGRFVSRSADLGSTTALEQLDRLADVAHNRMTAVEDIVDAGKALYGTLSAEQKRLADRRLAIIALQLAASGTAPPSAALEEAGAKRRSSP